MYEIWSDAVDRAVAVVLQQADIKAPPVDALDVAERMRLRVLEQKVMPVRGKLVRLSPQETLIVVRSDDRDERTQYALAHELGEYLASDVCRFAGEDWGGLSASMVEELAHLFAGRLLCPNPWFRDEAQACDGDLPTLKSIFETASHEVIALRLTHLEVPSVVTVMDNGAMVRRNANFSGSGGRRLLPLEQRLWESCHETGATQNEVSGSLQTQVWPVWERGFRREIIRTRALESD